MKIKVCGIRNKNNLSFLNASSVDFIGFIFYSKSARNFDDGDLQGDDLVQSNKQKVGVFVNESIARVEALASAYALDYIQLHGDESPEYCQQLQRKGFKLFKAFAIEDQLPGNLAEYEPYVDFFLFDTKGKSYGGSGTQFNWAILNEYTLNKPFFLSGGIGLEDLSSIKKLNHPKLFAVDVNSRFEHAPGDKDEEKIKEFIEKLNK